MPGSIVVPLDGSKNAENALPWAATLAKLYDTGVEFVHVLDHELIRDAGDVAGAEARFTAYTEALAGHFGISTSLASVLRGHPAEAIVEAAKRSPFLVIASHGRGGFRATFIGSVADKVLRASTVPVVVIPAIGAPASPDRRTVLVALDGSAAAERGLELARELAEKMGSTVTLVRAWRIPTQSTSGFDAYYPTQELFESVEAGAREYIASVGRRGEETFVVLGYAATAIADVAMTVDAEIVVVTTSGKGLAARIALGSTTERLAHSLHRPLLVVPVAG